MIKAVKANTPFFEHINIIELFRFLLSYNVTLWSTLYCLFFLNIQKLSVKYERFALALDEQFGQSLWTDYSDVANKGE